MTISFLNSGDEFCLIDRRSEIITKILDRVRVDGETRCWNWTGPTSGNGRGGGVCPHEPQRSNSGGSSGDVHSLQRLYSGQKTDRS